MSINRVLLLGNVGKAPLIRAIGSAGDKVATFSLATTDHWRDRATNEMRKSTEWHSIVCHNQHLVEVIASQVLAGSKVSVEGKIKTREYEKDGAKRRVTEIVIGRFDGTLTVEGDAKASAPATTATDMADTDIPF